MRYRGIAEFYAMLLAEVLELLRGEVGAVVGDDAMRDPEAADDGLEEIHSRSGIGVGDRNRLDPLRELVDYDEEPCVTSS